MDAKECECALNVHDVGFVNSSDLFSIVLSGIFKSKVRNATRRRLRDELNTLHNSVNNLKNKNSINSRAFQKFTVWCTLVDLVLDPTVLSFRVLTNCDQIDSFIQCSKARQWLARSDVGVQIKLSEYIIYTGYWRKFNSILSFKPTYFRRAKFKERCPLPTGVSSGLFNPILFLWIEFIAAWGIWNIPSGPFTGVTSTGSQLIGAYGIKFFIKISSFSVKF